MGKLINCECGQVIRADTEDEVLSEAEQHISENHPELVGKVSREQLADWIEEE